MNKTIGFNNQILPVHLLDTGSLGANILPLDHNNPYDYKREHRHSYYEIILIEKGGCYQLIDFVNYPGHDFSCYIICPQQVHLMNRKSASGTVVQFSEEKILSNELITQLKNISIRSNAAIIFENQPEIYEDAILLLKLLSKQLGKDDNTTTTCTTSLLNAFVSLIISQVNPTQNKLQSDENIIHDFCQLLECNYSRVKGVQFYLEKLGINEKKLSNSTKKHFGISPLQMIHNRIILETKRLLLFGSVSHKEIAFQLGFDSPASFSAFIKSKTCLSPTELKEQLAKTHK